MTTAGPMLVHLTPDLAAYAIHALRLRQHFDRTNGLQPPPGLGDLARVLASSASEGQRGTEHAGCAGIGHVEPVQPRLVTYEIAAAMLACSSRQVKRLVSDGALTPVSVGGLRRLRITDIDAYLKDA